MNDSLRQQVELLAEEYVRLARAQVRAKRHGLEWDEVSYAFDRLRQADEVLDFLRRSGRDPYTTLRDVDGVLSDAEAGLSGVQRVLDERGAAELLDDHLDTLMRALSAEALPGWEADLLDAWGFPDLARTIGARADLLGDEWRNGTASGVTVAREYQRAPVSKAMKAAEERIEKHRTEWKASEGDADVPTSSLGSGEPPKKQRRWWKGLGQVFQGAAIAGADIGLALGVLHIPVPQSGETYGVVMSVTMGAGTVMNGVGDLWGRVGRNGLTARRRARTR
jgi:hypothetical protein